MKFIIICVLATLAVVLAEYPSNLPKCSLNDQPCQIKAGQEFISKHYSGISEMNLLPMDPLHIKRMVLKRNPSSPVNIEVEFKDLDLIGLKAMKISKLRVSDFGARSEFEGTIPELTLKGNYKIDGKVLILPIVGEGATEIKCKNTVVRYSFDMKPVEKNGQTYATLEHVKMDIKPESVRFHFENLFKGDISLSDNMNAFINDNWSDIFQEIKPQLTKSLSLELKSMLQKFFSTYPYAEYFQ